MGQFDWEQERAESAKRSSSPLSSDEYDRQNPYNNPPYPDPYHQQRFAPPRPDRFGMAMTGFILGLFSFAVPLQILMLIFWVPDSNSSSDLGAMLLILLLLTPFTAVVGIILSIIAVRSSRGAKLAIAGIWFSALSMIVISALVLLIFIGLAFS
ncbi:hypothetical protein [Saccharibacillus sp. JS10]|uniref:hypothetical protein n=1 Tax=Saccharibacillus sp. JS10 TaxID=2950552 RepID=UPI00210EC76C|nr:hypothetical protein [Saccharibacillus sp. JS10]MCQ4085687.1 hypothetical protein [Saccharibacillus sp. JS10]